MNQLSARRRYAVLATVCLAAFAINLDTTIVNVALPDLGRQLSAGTRDLQWVVDGYNLAFAALVLSAGSIGDRFGRRPALIIGLGGFGLASGIGAMVGSVGALIAIRFLMGAFAALIFPTTLSIISNTFSDRSERAKAIGIWGAVTGLGVAVGPVSGGALLAHYSWHSVFVALVPVAVVAMIATAVLVPESSNPQQARLDLPGLLTSTAAISTLVYTIIEAPRRGWADGLTLAGFVLTGALVVVFVLIERRRAHPMIDVSLFRTPAFSAASGAVTVAFFALFGFIFLVTQYFQFIRGYGALSTGVRILPVATTIAVGSVGGVIVAGRVGTRVVVVTGLTLLATSFAWISMSATFMSYSNIVGQMVLMGLGLGLTTAPATESILSVLPPAKAGVGSAVNDATREAGGTLGVAVLGSIFISYYSDKLQTGPFASVGAQGLRGAQDSVATALGIIGSAQPTTRPALLNGLQESFMSGFHTASAVATGVCLLGALGALALPGRRHPAAAMAAEPVGAASSLRPTAGDQAGERNDVVAVVAGGGVEGSAAGH
jgi:EmrB/QacA subfamily drug resistance transporter